MKFPFLKAMTPIILSATILPFCVACNKNEYLKINITNNPNITVTTNKVKKNEELVITYSLSENYKIDEVNITIAGETIDFGSMTIDSTNHQIKINKDKVVGDINVSITAKLGSSEKIKIIINPYANCTTTTNEISTGENLIISTVFDIDYNYKNISIKIGNVKLSKSQYELNENTNQIFVDKSLIIGLDITIDISAVYDVDTETATEYIFNRSFSIMGSGSGSCLGTGWIYSDATPDVTNDYKYWMVTNMHVQTGMRDVSASSYDFTAYDGYQSYINYTPFTSFEYEAQSKFLYSGNIGIDVAVAKVDMSQATGQIKSQLDYLNKYQIDNGYITKTTNQSASVHYENSEITIGGYPAKETTYDFGAQWETHSISAGTFGYDFSTSHSHTCDQLNNIVDVSPQYYSKNVFSPGWMDSGASGSMGITKINKRWSVVGIYWGGFVDDPDTPTQFWPAFSVFNTDKKNFLKEY